MEDERIHPEKAGHNSCASGLTENIRAVHWDGTDAGF